MAHIKKLKILQMTTTSTQFNKSYLYMLLNPIQLPLAPFYIGIGHDEHSSETDFIKRFPRPFKGHHLLKDVDVIKRLNNTNSFKLNTIIKIKEKGLKVNVVILFDNLTVSQAKQLEKIYIKRFGRKGIDTNGTLTNVMPGGDGHDKQSAKYCRQFHQESKFWATSWMKDKKKVVLWKKHISESSIKNEKIEHWRSKNMKNVTTKMWIDESFKRRHSKRLSEQNLKNWNDPIYRKTICESIKKNANTEYRKKISANNLRTTINKLWKESDNFRKQVSERTRIKALKNNSDATIKKRQQLFRLISMYYNKYNVYPWDDENFTCKKSPTLLTKLIETFITDQVWLISRLEKIGQTLQPIEAFLKKEGALNESKV